MSDNGIAASVVLIDEKTGTKQSIALCANGKSKVVTYARPEIPPAKLHENLINSNVCEGDALPDFYDKLLGVQINLIVSNGQINGGEAGGICKSGISVAPSPSLAGSYIDVVKDITEKSNALCGALEPGPNLRPAPRGPHPDPGISPRSA